MKVLGLETSCDETAAAVVTEDGTLLAHEIFSQIETHRPYGGVVPEIAARAHLEKADLIVDKAMKTAGLTFKELDGVAATGGPGLIGGVLVGVMTAKAIAAVHTLPFLAVNHLEGHALSVRLEQDVDFPFLLLLASGGHCQILAVEDVGTYHRLGGTIDDAAGEAFDKVGHMLGLPYPGGPAVEDRARRGEADRFALPRPLRGKPGCVFSFSGLKSAVRRIVRSQETLPATFVDDMCASFQTAVCESVVDRLENGISLFEASRGTGRPLVVAGGVAANGAIRTALENLAARHHMPFTAPPLNLCTDNGAMIAWAGLEKLRKGQKDALDFRPRPRWPLSTPDAPAPPALKTQ